MSNFFDHVAYCTSLLYVLWHIVIHGRFYFLVSLCDDLFVLLEHLGDLLLFDAILFQLLLTAGIQSLELIVFLCEIALVGLHLLF